MHREYVCRPVFSEKMDEKDIFGLAQWEKDGKITVSYRSFGRETRKQISLKLAVNWEIVDASLAREKYSVIVPLENAGLSQSDTNYWRNGDRKLKAQNCGASRSPRKEER